MAPWAATFGRKWHRPKAPWSSPDSIRRLAVLTGLYSVPAERCRQAAALGEGFAGIEVRAMTNIGLEGFFKDGRSVELENCTAKDVADDLDSGTWSDASQGISLSFSNA
ncbi:unnamed protein product [Effrenium voratum]|nr:unnamed protein product [Effrenium voratum]